MKFKNNYEYKNVKFLNGQPEEPALLSIESTYKKTHN